jgi:branched-chain amino acid transport system ATP-binding protein
MTGAAGAPLLSAEGLCVNSGVAQLLDDVSFELPAGTALAVLGANGAGKSALGRALCGLESARRGRVVFAGTDITGWTPQRIRRAGLVYLPAGRGVFPGLSVLDNLRMAVRTAGARSDRSAALDVAFQQFPVLRDRRGQIAGSLSGGEQQMLSLARALAHRPQLVIADEISLGLAPKVVEDVFAHLARALAEGVALILIEQFIERALGICDNCIILQRGKVCWAGRSAEAGDYVIDRYLGSAHTADNLGRPGDERRPLLGDNPATGTTGQW